MPTLFPTAQANANNILVNYITSPNTFSIGTIITFDGANYIKADASSLASAEVVGMISYVAGANIYYVTQIGVVKNIDLSNVVGGVLNPGSLYWLDPTPGSGKITSTMPTGVGQAQLPLFEAITGTSGYFVAGFAQTIPSGVLFNWNDTPANTTISVNNGYNVTAVGSVTLTTPASAVVGDIFCVSTKTNNGVVIKADGTQTISLTDLTTSAGGTLTLAATAGVLAGTLNVLCEVAGATPLWRVQSGTGIWTVA